LKIGWETLRTFSVEYRLSNFVSETPDHLYPTWNVSLNDTFRKQNVSVIDT